MVLSDAHYFDEMGPKRYDEIRKLLDSSESRNKLEAMKRLLALMSTGKDASNFFPDVVKNVFGTSFEVKKLVYMFLVHYAEQQSDAALLSVNSFQKDLLDSNQLIRAQALRVLTSIRVSMIAHLQAMAIKKVMRDPSAYVRKAAALAIVKVYSLDPELKEELVDIIKVMLGDNSTMVIGSAISAFNEVCPVRSPRSGVDSDGAGSVGFDSRPLQKVLPGVCGLRRMVSGSHDRPVPEVLAPAV